MVDLYSKIANILSPLAKTETEFPAYENNTFPLITLTELSNVSTYEIEHIEIASEIIFQIDIWDKAETLQSVNELAQKVSETMHTNCFYRTFARSYKDVSGLMRNTMYFKIEVINLKE